VTGFALTIGSVGGMEFGSLSPMAALFLSVIGLLLALSPIRDGALYRLIDKI
tara:strand:+ start:18 stop:173 length:156 start_codon:yes stop_codon:yes gene_type:complete